MNTILLLLTKAGHSGAGDIVADAARGSFSPHQVREVETIKEALAFKPGASTEFLVLIEPRDAEVGMAVAAMDDCGLPRWPLVILGSGSGDPDGAIIALPQDEWSPEKLGRAFRLALAHHAARREAARGRGDIHSLGHRISHDLRAQLGGILSATEVLKEVIGDGSLPDISLLRPITDSTEATAKLLERISFATRASSVPRPVEEVNMQLAVWAAMQGLEPQIVGKQAQVDLPDFWPQVRGVASWLEVVWRNLLGNALQHGSMPPRVSVGWESADPELNEFRFWVKDNGPGVAVDKRGMLFHPFHRLHESTAPTGLGLPIVQRLVQLQAGRCGYQENPEGGSCFFFTLPNPQGDTSQQNASRT